jgi:pimeloyl-ACP methyl ester carboxylesterase
VTDISHIDTDLGPLAYRDCGSGQPAVVCVHGFCQSSLYWASVIERLGEAGARAIAVDLPGFGASADAPGPYSMEGYADRIAALLDALNIPRIVLMGGSMGGVVAQHFALRHPERLIRLVLVATGARTPDPDGSLAKADSLAQNPLSDDDIRRTVEGFFHRQPAEAEKRPYEDVVRAASRMAAVEAARSNARSNTLDQLGNIHVPTLILQGRHDHGRTPEHGAFMCTQMPDAELVILEQSGHTPQIEEPEAFDRVVIPFVLDGTPTRPGVA